MRLTVEGWNSLFSKVASISEGTINMLTDKGFGLIDTEKDDLFFHMSAAEDISYDELREGETVEQEECRGPKGQYAKSVKAGVSRGSGKRVQTVTCHSSTPCWQH